MKEIKQGTIFGYELVLKVPDNFPDDDFIINKNTLEKYVNNKVNCAIKEAINN